MGAIIKRVLSFEMGRCWAFFVLAAAMVIPEMALSQYRMKSTAFTGTPYLVPGKIEAENYDNGSAGVAYRDMDTRNDGGVYRTRSGVDLRSVLDGSSGYEVYNFATGEWLQYTVQVGTSGSYFFSGQVSSALDGSSLRVLINGVDVTGTVAIPNRGSWNSYFDLNSRSFNLSAGKHVVRVISNSQWFGFNSFKILRTPASTPVPSPAPTPAPVPTPSPAPMPVPSPKSSDSRTLMWFDPELPFNSQPTEMLRQFTGPSTPISQDSPQGVYVSSANDWVYQITQDPADSSKRALRHKIRLDFPQWNGNNSWRSELVQSGGISVNQNFWIAYAVYIPNNQVSSFVNILNLHHVNWTRPGIAPRAPIDTLVNNGNSLNIGVFGWWSDYSGYRDLQPPGHYCNIFGFDVNGNGTGKPTLPKDTWIYLIYNGRMTLDAGHQPFLKVWVAVDNGAPQLACDVKDKPFGYYNMPPDGNYLKFGLYSWEANTTFTKGVRFMKEAPGFSPALDASALLKSIRGF